MAALPLLRRLARWVKHAPDRLQHESRRRAALASLGAASLPRSILVVCHGNVCRSPYAAAALRRRFQSEQLPMHVASAGFIAPDRVPPREALSAANAQNADISGHRSRLVTRELLDAADLILVMNPGQGSAVTARRPETTRRVLVLGDLDPQPIATREIADPWGQPRATFDACYDRIDRCVEQLVRTLAGIR